MLSFVVAAIIACAVGLYLNLTLEVCLNGDNATCSEVFSEYTDLGAKGYVNISALGFKKEIDTIATNNLDNKKLGTYKFEYKASFLGKEALVSRTINVIDTVSPTITADESISVDFASNPNTDIYSLPINFTATDLYDGDITEKVEKTYEKDGCVLAVSDSSGNASSFKVMFDFADKKAPIVTLEDAKTVYLLKGEKYIETVYTATDEVDGDLTKQAIDMSFHLTPWVIIGFSSMIVTTIYEEISSKKSIELVKNIIKFNGKKESVKQTDKNKLAINVARGVIIGLSVVLIVVGIFNGGAEDVLQKAINICTECIGLG